MRVCLNYSLLPVSVAFPKIAIGFVIARPGLAVGTVSILVAGVLTPETGNGSFLDMHIGSRGSVLDVMPCETESYIGTFTRRWVRRMRMLESVGHMT